MRQARPLRAGRSQPLQACQMSSDRTATRRLTLAAREGGALGLLLRHKLSDAPSAAFTRWQVAAAPSVPDEFRSDGDAPAHARGTRGRRARPAAAPQIK